MKTPSIDSSVFTAKESVIIGDVTIEADCSIWYHTTIRAERASAVIKKGSNIQDNAVVHVDEGYPVHIGEHVTVGHSAIIHGCKVGDNSLVGMGAIILNGAEIGKNCIIGAGTLVTQHMIIPDNSLVVGNPGKVLRSVTVKEIEGNRKNAEAYIKEGHEYKQL